MRVRSTFLLLTGILAVGLSALPSAIAQSAAEISVTFDSARTDPGTYAYEPDLTRVDVGATVTWENVDDLTDPDDNNAVDHPTQCIKGQAKGTCPWGTEDLPPGGTFSVTFPEPGTFPYFCAVHPYMEGTIVVGSGEPPAEPTQEPTAQPTSDPAPSPTSRPSSADPEPSSEPDGEATTDDLDPSSSATQTEEPDDVDAPSQSATAMPEPSTSATDDDLGEVVVGSEDPSDGSGLLKVVAGLAVLGAGGLGIQQLRGRP